MPLGFSYRRKRPHLEILNFVVTALSNHDRKVAFLQVDEYGSLARSSLNGKSESSNK